MSSRAGLRPRAAAAPRPSSRCRACSSRTARRRWRRTHRPTGSRTSSGRPSSVSTRRPATRSAGCAQETTARPSTMTVQAPQEPSGAQPSFIERRPQVRGARSSSDVPGSMSTVTGHAVEIEVHLSCHSCMTRGHLALAKPLPPSHSVGVEQIRPRTVPLDPFAAAVRTRQAPRRTTGHATVAVGQDAAKPGGRDATAGTRARGRGRRGLRADREADSARPASSCPPSPSWPTRRDPRRHRGRGSPTSIPTRPHPRNLFRVHWYNDARRARAAGRCPSTSSCRPSSPASRRRSSSLLGDRFPMIHSHKVIAAYGCLAPRIVTGQFDPTSQRAVWPSTGNYCRGGVAISRIMGCRGVAVLPEGMSRERFDWLAALGQRPGRHHPHAGHGEQRQGDLRRAARSSTATPTRSSSTSSASSGTTSPTTRSPGRAARARLRGARGGATRRCGWRPSSRPPGRPARSPPATTSRSATAR